MRLIGLLANPVVRRTAIALATLGVQFELEPLSMFRSYDAFAAINPVVKSPTFVTDDGTLLMDSSVIIDYGRGIAAGGDVLMPGDTGVRLKDLRLIGLALETYSIVLHVMYETQMRPADKRHEPWVERALKQLEAACDQIDAEIAAERSWLASDPLTLSAISLVVAGSHIRQSLLNGRERIDACRHFSDFIDEMEARDVFRRYAPGSSDRGLLSPMLTLLFPIGRPGVAD